MTQPRAANDEPMTVTPDGPPDKLYRLLVERVVDYAIFALDPDGRIMSWNLGAQRLKQYTAAEAIGRHFSMFYPRTDIAARKPEWELEVATRDGRVEDEGWRLRKDGSRFWANVLITALRDDSGKLVGFAKVTRDLTAQRQASEEIRLSEERFRLLMNSVTDYAIYMLDPDGRITTWNIGAERIKGYSEQEVIGQDFSIFYTPDDLVAGKPRRELEIASTTGVYQEEGWRVRKDGTRFWASVVLTPVYGAGGKLAGYAKVTRDLTERRAAAELERRNEQTELANRAKSQFLAAMSHELRTPLNAIGGYAQLMQLGVSGPVTEAQLANLSRIQRSQQHLLGIINDILNFSRIEAGMIDYDIGDVDVGRVIDDVLPMVTVQAEAKSIVLETSECDPALVLRADRSKTEQILVNLLSNAVKFTPDGGRIGISCHGDRDIVRLTVRDNGIGIPRDQLESVFSPFVQVGRNLANPMEGAGLGLAISRDLARAMRGDLTVESVEGEGAAFTVTLPRAKGAAPATTED